MDLAGLADTARPLFMPLLGFAAVGVLALVLRWSQTPHRTRLRRSPAPEQGLLLPIASFPTQDAAEALAARLRRDGIRTALAPSVRGIDVLVWPEEYGEARLRLRDGST